jgi:hypothetical protein
VLSGESGMNRVPTEIPAAPSWRFIAACIIAIAAGLGLAQIVTLDVPYLASRWPDKQPPDVAFFSANDRSRWCTVWSLVHRGTYQIDEIMQRPGWDSIDKVKVDGHFYSTKPALYPTLVAGLYRLGQYRVGQSTLGLDLDRHPHETIRVLLGIVNLVPWIVALIAFAALLERLSSDVTVRTVVLLTAAFGTFLSPFLITLNNHTPAAVSAMFTLWAVWPIWSATRDENTPPIWRYAVAGLFAAWTTCNELPAFPFSIVIALVCLRSSPVRTLTAFTLAALVPLVGFFVTTYASTGSPLPFYTKFGTDAYRYVHEGIPSYWMEPTGIDRGAEPGWLYLFHCTLGHHGIWSLSPVFLLTLIGWWTGLKRRTTLGRQWELQLLGCLLTAWILTFYLAQTKSYNYGGNTAGLRWAFWLIPFWLVGLVPALTGRVGMRGPRLLVAPLLALSVFSAWYPVRNPWQAPWLQVALERLGWQGYDEPAKSLPAPRKTWLGSIPEQIGAGIELSAEGPGGVPFTWTLTLIERTPTGTQPARATIESVLTRGGARDARSVDRDRIDIDLTRFEAGASPAEFLLTNTADRAKLVKLLSGLPAVADYRGGAIRYLKLPLRPTEAFRCVVAGAGVRVRRTETAPELAYRRQIWWSDEVPFGVVQFDDTIRDPLDNSFVARLRWQLTRVILPK